MKQSPAVQDIDKKILRLKHQLMKLGPLHPGSLSRQYQVCGKPGCKCVDPQNPQPHGPYSKLTYVYHGKFTCRFVRAGSLKEVAALLTTFKTFRQLTDDWIALAIQRAQLGPLERGDQKIKATPPRQKTSTKVRCARAVKQLKVSGMVGRVLPRRPFFFMAGRNQIRW